MAKPTPTPDPAAAPTTATASAPIVKPRTATQLEQDYKSLLAQVQASDKSSVALERELQKEIKAKVKAHAGDLEKLKAQKLAAHSAWQSQLRIETANALAEKLKSEAAAAAAKAPPPPKAAGGLKV